MAFIREYAQTAGDPFRFRIPKAVRKWAKRAVRPPAKIRKQLKQLKLRNITRGLGKVAPYALMAFAPQLAPLAAGAFGLNKVGQRTDEPGPTEPVEMDRPAFGGIPPTTYQSPGYGMEISAPRAPRYEPDDDEDGDMYDPDDYYDFEGDPDELMEEFARGYGLDMGDPGRRRPKAGSALAGASAPPSAKAKRRRSSAAKKRARVAGAAARGKGRKSTGPRIDYGRLGEAALGAIPIAGGVASELYGQLRGGRGAAGAAGGRRRRSMNPANVRALRKSIRRVEGFQKLVKRVEKQFPAMRRAHHHQGGGGGHKRGCRCVACKGR